ncbi:MAG: ABC transporter ATP-binding protein, partial [Actinomycetota bacterium]|nr:ABC transporter ATP-binding protein [Actinomycetota bacterium]
MAQIVVQDLVRTYPGAKHPATDHIDLNVGDGEFMVLLGPSGCGKTTLLRQIAGLDLPDSGAISIGGRDVTYLPPRERRLAMVFQSYAVFPHRNVADNIGFGLAMRKDSKAKIKEKVQWAASLLQLEPYLDRYPAKLSGGQRQRVAVARAIVMEPDVLLMDEPLSNLDALLRLSFRAELKKLVQDLGTTCVYVTHDQVEALSLGDRVAVMSTG